MKNKIDNLSNAWLKRESNPLKVALDISEFLKEENTSVHKIALMIGARSADIAAFLNLSALCPEAQEYFEKFNLPVAIAIDIVDEEDDFQIKILKKLCDDLPKKEKILDAFDIIINKEHAEKFSWRNELKGKHIMHLSSKAKNYDALSKKQRGALFSFGMKLQNKKTFTIKQRKYFYDLLEICRSKGLLSTSCFNVPCEMCNEIVKIIENK